MTRSYAEFPSRPVPPVTSETREWWEHTRDRTLTVQQCKRCDHAQFYPRALCVSCGSNDLDLVKVRGTGSVYSFTTVFRSPAQDHFVPPYVVALVRLTEGPVLLTNIVTAEPEDVSCDLPVTLVWDQLPDGRHLPLFTPDSTAG
ncbi:Zn-ribbon domain-containing OB-fold protein [Mycolicibacterium goodii]|uniref:DNA-binding protein n=1 Tax=Mycolicibacterium goodii TaxID=134601 RepID=A0A0K0X3W6_MYCGD|nr:hypothetical protein AFA91_09755 [Mycolicibacterium goodii]